MSDTNRDPVRRLKFPFTGDPWAQPLAQVEVPAPGDADRDPKMVLTSSGGPVRFRVVPYSGMGPNATPVDGDASTFNATIVKVKKDRKGNTTLSRTATNIEKDGVQGVVGQDQTELDMSIGDRFVISFVSAAQDTAAALWVFVDGGLK